MKRHLLPVTAAFALSAAAVAGCVRDPTRGPIGWTATNPSSAVGQTEAQAWSRSTSNPDRPAADTDRAPGPTPVDAPPTDSLTSKVELPSGASLAAIGTVREDAAFGASGPHAGATGSTTRDDASVGPPAAGPQATDRVYRTALTYGDTVDFFDRTLAQDGFEGTHRATTGASTQWWGRGPDGGRIHVAVRNTSPTTIEIVEAGGRTQRPISGVTNAQPPAP